MWCDVHTRFRFQKQSEEEASEQLCGLMHQARGAKHSCTVTHKVRVERTGTAAAELLSVGELCGCEGRERDECEDMFIDAVLSQPI